jgi:hypothetical protein
MSDIIEPIGSHPPPRGGVEHHIPQLRDKPPLPEPKAANADAPREPAPPRDMQTGPNQSAASYRISLDPGTMRAITEVVDRATGDVLFSIPTGYRRERGTSGGIGRAANDSRR